MSYRLITCERQLTCCFFFNDTATTEIYTLSLHDALPISSKELSFGLPSLALILRAPDLFPVGAQTPRLSVSTDGLVRSEEHTSELQSRQYLVCRLLLEKKKTHLQHTTLPSPAVHLLPDHI